MTAALATIAPTVAKLIRLLGSDRDGEVLGAARALRRVLHGAGLDLHALADVIEVPADLQSTGTDDWRAQLQFAARRIHQLSPREADFISTLVHSTRWREPSEKQQAWLASIAFRLRRAA